MIIYKQLTELPQEYIEHCIAVFLDEDKADSDYTTEYTVPDNMQSTATVEAEDDLVFVGKNIIKAIFKGCNTEVYAEDGDIIKPGDVIAKIEGNSAYILSRERVMLNLVQRLSGIATSARKYSEAVKAYNVKIFDTRKTTPGLRLFEKYAVKVGGAFNHRLNLETDILIKDNHICAAGGIKQAVQNVLMHKKPDMAVELEVISLEQIEEALPLGIDGFLLDNMRPEMIRRCVELIRLYPGGENIFVEASGGINYDTVIEYAQTGVDGISIGALTHRIVSANIHLIF